MAACLVFSFVVDDGTSRARGFVCGYNRELPSVLVVRDASKQTALAVRRILVEHATNYQEAVGSNPLNLLRSLDEGQYC